MLSTGEDPEGVGSWEAAIDDRISFIFFIGRWIVSGSMPMFCPPWMAMDFIFEISAAGFCIPAKCESPCGGVGCGEMLPLVPAELGCEGGRGSPASGKGRASFSGTSGTGSALEEALREERLSDRREEREVEGLLFLSLEDLFLRRLFPPPSLEDLQAATDKTRFNFVHTCALTLYQPYKTGKRSRYHVLKYV